MNDVRASVQSEIPLFFARLALGAGDQSYALQKVSAAVAEFKFDSDHAVEPAYLDQVRKTLSTLPTTRNSLRTGIKGKDYTEEENLIDNKTYDYISGDESKQVTIRRNPFNLIRPKGIKSVHDYIYEQQKDWYVSALSRIDMRVKGSFGMARESEQMDDNFIRVNHAFNVNYVGFLESLNIADATERAKRIEQIGTEIFDGKSFGFIVSKTEDFKKIAPFDNPTQWMVYMALNVLVSPEPGITGIARYRAMEVLSHFNQEEIELSFFGRQQQRSVASGRGRNAPSSEWQDTFQKTLLRLPRPFWTQSDRKVSIHTNWMNNPTIVKILGYTEGLPPQKSLDYAEIANRLVEQNPREAIQVELLLLAGQNYMNDHGRQALQALIKFAQLDKATILKVFGPFASYNKIHLIPGSDAERMSESLGIDVFDEDIAAEFKGLSNEELLQVVRRLQMNKLYLMEQLAKQSSMASEAYFSTADAEKIIQVDPKGYWRLLGVHPDTAQEDRAEVLKAAYARLARKYHPDMTESPDEEKMKAINEAYGVLSDEEQRKIYCGF